MSAHSSARVALIIPAYNEAPVIGQTVRALPPGMFDWVMVADNGSTDGTGEEARAAGARVTRTEEKGYGAACLAALEALPVEATHVVFLQADGSEDADEACHLLAPLLDGRADLVLGSRTLGQAEPGALLPHQRFGNWLTTSLIRLLYGHRYTDLGPYRAMEVKTLLAMGMRERTYGWTLEMQVLALEQGLRVVEVPVRYGRRQAGENKVSGNLRASIAAGIKITSTVFRLWLTRRERASAARPSAGPRPGASSR